MVTQQPRQMGYAKGIHPKTQSPKTTEKPIGKALIVKLIPPIRKPKDSGNHKTTSLSFSPDLKTQLITVSQIKPQPMHKLKIIFQKTIFSATKLKTTN